MTGVQTCALPILPDYPLVRIGGVGLHNPVALSRAFRGVVLWKKNLHRVDVRRRRQQIPSVECPARLVLKRAILNTVEGVRKRSRQRLTPSSVSRPIAPCARAQRAVATGSQRAHRGVLSSGHLARCSFRSPFGSMHWRQDNASRAGLQSLGEAES